ncbi:PEP-CTERM sorting domain-containing protein [Paraglaciecola sp. L3A3]|uniref:PEP-CTERM sorting domain-containing protein n=1 Tax=Paraglaciecola sp. L3A3 TaxID=2686358 RepID=UPI00131ABD9E|nr:PEP-CTERM sorting domain-containing protein [Paraglaciecola sp. L3A3]
MERKPISIQPCSFIPDAGGRISVQDIDLQDSLEKISSTATLALENGQHFATSGLLTNQGQIRLDDAKLSSVFVVNEGEIVGNGDLNTHVINTGVVTASGGQLNLGSVISNGDSFETGTIEVANTYGDVLHLNNTHVIGGNLNVAENGQVEGSGNIDGVLVANQGKIVSDGTGLDIDFASGSSNTGTILSTNGSNMSLQGQPLQNDGGLIRLDQGSTLDLKGITVIQGAVEVVGNGSVLSGYGTLDNIALQISEGTVTANVDGQRLTLDPGETAQLMRATLRAENGGILLLTQGDFDNGGGTLIEAREGSVVEIKNITMNGGRLETIGDGKIIDLGSSDFTNMSFNANTEVANGGEFNLHGTIINTSSLTALNGGEIVMHDATITATTLKTITQADGTVTFEPVASDGQLNIAAGGTLKGEGKVDELAMDNQGTIHADGSKALIFDLKGDLFTNNGKVEVSGDGGMQIDDNQVVNNGKVDVQSTSTLTLASNFVQQGGELKVDGKLLASNVTIDQGSLAGSGVVDADVTVNVDGRIGRGSLILMQDLDLFGTLEIDMNSSGLLSMLDVHGDVTVGGSTQFELIFAADYNPLDSLDFDFSLFNNFINLDLLSVTSFVVTGLAEQLDWAVIWDDAKGGFAVDIFNDDSWTASNDVPEPHTIMLLLFGIAFLVLRRKEPMPKGKNDEFIN